MNETHFNFIEGHLIIEILISRNIAWRISLDY